MTFFSAIGSRLDMMQDMFRQTGAMESADHSYQQAASLRQATQRCMSCGNAEACRKWLDIGFDEGLENRDVPEFCPNQALQNEMKFANA